MTSNKPRPDRDGTGPPSPKPLPRMGRPNETRGPRRRPDALDRLALVIVLCALVAWATFIVRFLVEDPQVRIAFAATVVLLVVALAFVRLLAWWTSEEEQGPGGRDRP